MKEFLITFWAGIKVILSILLFVLFCSLFYLAWNFAWEFELFRTIMFVFLGVGIILFLGWTSRRS